ncbi:MAG: pilus assembly protein [Planctomycetota bacterium]|nr:pilus assembly protein [Planctomycetota bacterium]
MPTTKRRRRGAVMLETVMILPFLAVIIGLTFFFGRAIRNQQQVQVTARHMAWRNLAGPWPGYDTAMTYNQALYQGRANPCGDNGGEGPDPVRKDYIQKADAASARAGKLADQAVASWPDGVSDNASAGFPTEVGMWKWFKGDTHFRHSRDGVEWRRGQVSYLETIRDQFLMNLHHAVQNVPDVTLRQNLQALYLQQW